jgi:arsenite methyltransferase
VDEDFWAAWLRRRRTGGDDELETQMLDRLADVRDRVLDNARFAAGETLLDVGCGNGLVAFGALGREAGRVVFADVSEPLLQECRAIAAELGALDRCEFVLATAEALDGVADGSVDVATTRSVLIYVAAKAAAFAELFRVLRPGGRISLFEPVNTFGMQERRREFFALDDPDLGPIGAKLDAVFAERQPDTDPMLDFDERDLVALAEGAGFFPVRLDLRLDVEPQEPRSWEGFLHSSGNPKLPTFAEAFDEALSADERKRFVAYLRPRVEQGLGRWRMGSAYLWATKPG